jgi:polygalacturonase
VEVVGAIDAARTRVRGGLPAARRAVLLVMTAACLASLLAAVRPAPATARPKIPVPPTIDPTGATDVTARLRTFIAAAPRGSIVVLRQGARYRVDGTLELRDRRGLTLDGNGATLFAGTLGGPDRAAIRLLGGRSWTLRNLTVAGSKPPDAGFDAALQWQHGIDLRGVRGATLRHVTARDVWGDGIYVGMSTDSAVWSRDVSIIDSGSAGTGRMGVAVTAGRNVLVHGGTWSQPGLSTFDIEPNGIPGGARRVTVERVRLGGASRDRALDITGSGPVSDITFRDNILVGRPLHVRVDQGDERPRNITVQNNLSSVLFTGPPPAAMVFHNTDGVTVSGNRQPLPPGSDLHLVAVEGSTRVSISEEQPYRGLRDAMDGRPPIRAVASVVGAAAAVVALFVGRHIARRRR